MSWCRQCYQREEVAVQYKWSADTRVPSSHCHCICTVESQNGSLVVDADITAVKIGCEHIGSLSAH